MKSARREFIKQFGFAGVVAAALVTIAPQKAYAGVGDNLKDSENVEALAKAIAEIQSKMGTTEISSSVGGTVTDALANAVYIESWDPDTKELRLKSADYVSEDA